MSNTFQRKIQFVKSLWTGAVSELGLRERGLLSCRVRNYIPVGSYADLNGVAVFLPGFAATESIIILYLKAPQCLPSDCSWNATY